MKKKVRIPSVTMFSEYFRCPRCGWTTDGPRLVLVSCGLLVL